MALKPAISSVMLLDLGKRTKKKIKALKKGQGDLVAEIAQYLQQNGTGGDVVPVVILFEQKKKKKMVSPLLPYLKL